MEIDPDLERRMITPGGNTIPLYSGGKVRGMLVRPSGIETPITSGYAGPSAGVKGVPQMNGNIKSHVEAHVAVIIRRESLGAATLCINKIPCPTKHPRSRGCADALSHMLPEGTRLRVLGPDGFDQIFVGLADPLGMTITGL